MYLKLKYLFQCFHKLRFSLFLFSTKTLLASSFNKYFFILGRILYSSCIQEKTHFIGSFSSTTNVGKSNRILQQTNRISLPTIQDQHYGRKI